MKIAILGFGNLIKIKSKNLSIGKWQQSGPTLPLEFSRISKDGRLALVIDQKNGTDNTVFFALSRCKSLKNAVDQFQKHEKINFNRVGILDIKSKLQSECVARRPKILLQIYSWAKDNKIDAVIWNDLGVKFKSKVGYSYSVYNAFCYLNKLAASKKKFVIKYIKSVPKEINTVFRTQLNKLKRKA